MSRVITFSQTFPAYHPKAGQPTYFVEQIWNGLISMELMGYDTRLDLPTSFLNSLSKEDHLYKFHTIRLGNRWKVGDKFSPRIWSGKPYRSKQITIAPDIEVKKVWDFKIEKYHDGYWIDFGAYKLPPFIDFENTGLSLLAMNDGLSVEDLLLWFKYPKPLEGQIICWNENIYY